MTTHADPMVLEPSRPRAAGSSPGAVETTEELHVERLDGWAASGGLEHLWNDLLADSASRTVFLTWEWLTSWWNAYGGSRQLMILTCLDRAGTLVGIAPLYCDRAPFIPGLSLRVLRFIGDGTHDSDNLDFIVRRGSEKSAIRAWSEWLDHHQRDWDLLELNSLPAESCLASLILEESRRRRWHVVSRETPRALLCLPRDGSAYLASLSESMRSTIRNRTRHLERNYRVRFVRCESAADLASALQHLFRLHGKRWEARGGGGAFGHSQRRAFLKEVTERLQVRSWLDFWSLEVDDQVVATELGFCYGDTRYFLQAGFDPDWYPKNVGVVLRARILRHLIDGGVRYYDFLDGGDDYKFRWGAERRSYLSLRCARACSRGGLFLRLGGLADSAKEALRRHTPASAWTVLRKAFRWVRPYRG